MPDSCWLLKYWIHVLPYWRVLEFNLKNWPLSLLALPLCYKYNVKYSQQADLHRKKICNLLFIVTCSNLTTGKFYTTTAIKIAVCECKISTVSRKQIMISLPTKTLHGILTSLKVYISDNIARVFYKTLPSERLDV